MDEHNRTSNTNPPSKAEVISSAKVVIDAAKSALTSSENEKIDKNQVMDAAADLLGATSHYGKADDKSTYGKILGKAEEYLHSHSSPHSSSQGDSAAAHKVGAGAHGEAHNVEGKKEHGHGGGYGDYVKMAQGLMNKNDQESGHGHSSHGGENVKVNQESHKKDDGNHGGQEGHGHGHASGDGGGGYGEYVKMAQGLMNKHDNKGSEHGSDSGGGYGEYIKMAQEIMKKP